MGSRSSARRKRRSGWNGRYLGTGNGGIAGLIVYGTLANFLPLNYAVANTDMGTSPAATDPLGGRVLTGHPEKQIDYATRSTNLMSVRSKQIIEAFYGERPKYSYFVGCSTGGGQAVHEALQFPGDYDGIVARAPAINRTHNAAGNIWNYAAFNRSPVNITAAQATAITGAIVKQCAGKDGGLSSDNFLTDPRDCHWDPAALQCRGGAGDAAMCLTAPQVAAMRKFYEGPINPRTGERIFAGQVRGSESNSGYPAAIPALPTALNSPYWVFGNEFDPLTFDFDHDNGGSTRKLRALEAPERPRETRTQRHRRIRGGFWSGCAPISLPILEGPLVNRQIPSRRQFTDFPRSFDTIDLRSV